MTQHLLLVWLFQQYIVKQSHVRLAHNRASRLISRPNSKFTAQPQKFLTKDVGRSPPYHPLIKHGGGKSNIHGNYSMGKWSKNGIFSRQPLHCQRLNQIGSHDPNPPGSPAYWWGWNKLRRGLGRVHKVHAFRQNQTAQLRLIPDGYQHLEDAVVFFPIPRGSWKLFLDVMRSLRQAQSSFVGL